ncbi:alpha/beta hydrolase [Gemmobacter lanyuensis]
MQDPDTAYSNGAFIAGAEGYPPRWQAEAAAFRSAMGARAELDLPYGPTPREALDLFLPAGAPRGVLMFIHGGYWLAFGRELWSHLAAGAVARGWACAMPSYTLAPEARIGRMTAQIARAAQMVAARLPDLPMVITGHSAGGHLSARMGCADQAVPGLRRVVPISPLADLAPLMVTGMNAKLRLDAAECAAESPARLTLQDGVQAHVWVGGQERPAFLWQARTLSEAWDCPWTVDPGKHHFDVIDGLVDPASALAAACMDGI